MSRKIRIGRRRVMTLGGTPHREAVSVKLAQDTPHTLTRLASAPGWMLLLVSYDPDDQGKPAPARARDMRQGLDAVTERCPETDTVLAHNTNWSGPCKDGTVLCTLCERIKPGTGPDFDEPTRCLGCGEPSDVGIHGLNQGFGGCV